VEEEIRVNNKEEDEETPAIMEGVASRLFSSMEETRRRERV